MPEQLAAGGVDVKDIEAAVWSHHHWDHTGDMSEFSPSTALIVGPGAKDALMPGYPADPKSPILESDYQGREVREIDFKEGVKIGRFGTYDYFGDGSFYLLDSPGHAVGHLCALARVTAGPDSFVFMGGDACHHAGLFRPSEYKPLPDEISPNPLGVGHGGFCPGSVFEKLLPEGSRTRPFFAITKGENQIAFDAEKAQQTVGKVLDADAQENVLVVIAHDDSLLDVIDFFPKNLNGFVEKGWVDKGRWLFLKDFALAVRK